MDGRQAARLAAVDLCRSVDGTDRDFDQAGQPGPGIIRAEALRFLQRGDWSAQIPHNAYRSRRPVRGAADSTKRSARHSPRAHLALELPQLINVIRGDMSL